MEQRPRAARQHLGQPPRSHDRRERNISAGDSLPQRHDVRHHPVRLQRGPGAGRPAPVSTSSAISSTPCRSQAAGPAASTPAPAPTRRWRSRRPARPDRGHRVGSLAKDRRLTASPLQLGQSGGRRGRRSGRHRAPARGRTRPASRESRSCSARGRTRRAPAGCCRDSRREREDFPPVRLAGLDPVLPGELERRLDRLRPAGERIDQLEVAGRSARDLGGELLDRIVGERGAVHVGEPLRLPAHRRSDLPHAVAHVDDEGAPERSR